MNLIECCARLGGRTAQHRRRTPGVPAVMNDSEGRDAWVIYAAAGVSLSGMIDDITDDAGIDEALEHFAALVRMEVVGEEAWHRESVEVGVAVVEHARKMDDDEGRIAHGVHAFQLLPALPKGGA